MTEMTDIRDRYSSEYCDVEYVPGRKTVLVTWKRFCCGEDYRKPLRRALEIIARYRCSYTADTRSGFENEPEDTEWVAVYFMPEAAKNGCKCIWFIIDEENSLRDELEGQQADSEDIIAFRYIRSIDEVEIN